MTSDPKIWYSAYASRDPRFDGVFFIGVTSTGIYCRPVCTARTPRQANCRFFPSAAAAEAAAFRPCLRCRPELAPGSAPVDGSLRMAHRIADRIDEALIDEEAGLETIAAEFDLSSRQLRRIVRQELGVSPMELVLTRRLLLAKQLLTETALPVTEIAFASGFASLRRFNDAFRKRYGMAPTRLRRSAAGSPTRAAEDGLTLRLGYRPPLDWDGLLEFLAARAMAGVEVVRDGAYLRSVRLGSHTGWVRVRHEPERRSLLVDVTHSLTGVMPALLGRLRHLFDLSARPDLIAEALGRDPLLAEPVRRVPGLRVPGAFDGFELAVRAVLGQQVTVKAASTLAGRLAAALGDPVVTPHDGVVRLSPTPRRVAAATVDEIASLGIIRTRAESIVTLAREVVAGRLSLEPGANPETVMARLASLPGIGPWTAQYIAMRALRWPDAFPKEDVVLRQRLGGVSAGQAEARADGWRPWRSYAVLHLWRMPATV